MDRFRPNNIGYTSVTCPEVKVVSLPYPQVVSTPYPEMAVSKPLPPKNDMMEEKEMELDRLVFILFCVCTAAWGLLTGVFAAYYANVWAILAALFCGLSAIGTIGFYILSKEWRSL
jgi:hypothetical protein